MTPVPPINLTDPEYPRLLDICEAGQAAMYHAATPDADHPNSDTIAVIIAASKTSPGVMTIKCLGMEEEALLDFLTSIIEATEHGNYRSIDR